jgi:hypothetical protein
LDTKTFLTRIFPQVDELVICTHKPDKSGKNKRGFFWNRGSFADIDAAVSFIQELDNDAETTVYYSIGAFGDHAYTVGKSQRWYRTQEKATWFKTLALDLDIGADTPYVTQKDGWTAISAALKTIGMPQPMVISSGNGIHLYWPLTQKISKEHWVKASTALRMALQEQNVVIDTSKIHDPSMVLRPVGTFHKKQTPWKEVQCKADCPDYDAVSLFTTLKPWFGKLPSKAKSQAKAKGVSSIAEAVLNTNDVDIDKVAENCAQIRALIESGGVTDAAGNEVKEPMWRASLGMAKHTKDVQVAVIKLAGKHKDFSLQSSLDKIKGWHGTGPTLCETFEQLCNKGCEGCPHKGKLKSPAQLSASAQTEIVTDEGEIKEITLPKSYVIKNGQIYKEVSVEVTTTDASGNKVAQTATDFEMVSPYEMHITGVYNDPESKRSAFRLAIKYPMIGWLEEDHELPVLATLGKDFSSFLLNRQVFIKSPAQQEKLRGYLMDYLTMVQSMAPSGMDYVSFGWQPDGSFLCGEKVIGSPTGVTDRRLRGPAEHFIEMVKEHGERAEWVKAMDMLNNPGTETIRSAVLLATAGILGQVAGNASMVISIYSNETTTGKSLALIAANSLIGTPKPLLMSKNDTQNAFYKIRGVLNNLPCTVDELTGQEDKVVADFAYDLSQGREKISMTKDRDLRKPAAWDGPTLISTNISLHQKFELVQSNNDPLKARCLELHHHDRTFIKTDETGSSNGYRFFDILAKNNGWAFPELVEAVIAYGGPEVVWQKGEAAFVKKVGFVFEPQERFYKTGIVSAWIMGNIGKKLGLFPFDIEDTIKYLVSHIVKYREQTAANQQDVFDTIGQFLLEHNDQIVEATEKYGSGKEMVREPAPEKAVARVKVTYDDKFPVMPGSILAINAHKLKLWLSKQRDGLDRIERLLQDENALIARRERVTMFKGCAKRSPGQTHCILVNLNHPRFIETLTGTNSRSQSRIALAVLNGETVAEAAS